MAPGEVLGVVGPNGAGTSTLLKVASGELSPRAGTVRYDSTNITGWTVRRRVAAGPVQVPEHRHLFWGMSVLENPQVGAMATQHRTRGRLTRCSTCSRSYACAGASTPAA